MIIPLYIQDHKHYAAWLAFHEDYKFVMDRVVQELRKAQRRGFKRSSVRDIMSHLRWTIGLQMSDDAGFKINNNYTPIYAAIIVANHPDLADMIEQRGARATA